MENATLALTFYALVSTLDMFISCWSIFGDSKKFLELEKNNNNNG